MRKQIGQLAAGRVNKIKPNLTFSEEIIDLSVIEDRDETGSFLITCTSSVKLRGIVYSTNPRMECLNPHFEGEKVRIRYQFHSLGLMDGDTSEGKFVIVCNQMEYSIPYCARISRLHEQSSVGAIKNLDDFTNLARNNWHEAYQLFYSKSFMQLISLDEKLERMTYRGMMGARPSGQCLEEFLIGIHRKAAVRITVDTSEQNIDITSDHQSECFEITKEGWGYTRLIISTDCDFIKLSKPVINMDDFIGKTYRYDYIVDKEFMHSGKNLGRIYIEDSYRIYQINVTAYVADGAGRNDINSDIKDCKVGIMELYQAYRLKKIVTGVWANETITILEHLHAIVPDEPMYVLMKAQSYIINRQRQEAEWILKDFRHSWNDKKAPVWGYYLYLMTLMEREPSYVDKMTHEIEMIFYDNPDSVMLFWILLFLQEQYFDNSARKLHAIENWVLNGCTSPYLYIEAFYLISQEPYLLTRIDTFQLRILRWAERKNALSKELAQQIFDVVDISSIFDKNVFNLLVAAYNISPEPENAGIICSYLIKWQQYDVKYHEWFEKGIELELRITGLYEAFLLSMDDRKISAVPKIIQLYFQYDNRLPYRKLAVLYNNIIAAKESQPQVYNKYRRTMGRFAMEQAELCHIDDNLAVLYDDMIDLGFINAELAHALSHIIFSHKLIVFDKNIVRAVVYQSQLEEPKIVPVIDNVAYFQLYSDDYVILLEDEKGHRYVDSVSFRLQKLMSAEKYISRCLELASEDVPYVVFNLKSKDAYTKLKPQDVRNLRILVKDKAISREYKSLIIPELLKYYKIHENDESIRDFLEGIDEQLLSAKARRYYMDMLVLNRMYERAYDLVRVYGIDQISDSARVTLCVHEIEVETAEDGFLTSLALSAYETKKYNDSILEYLCDRYVGPTDIMLEVWQDAQRFGCSSTQLEERILEQSLYTGRKLNDVYDVFEKYYNSVGNELLVLAYVTALAHAFLVSDDKVSDDIFSIIEGRYKSRRGLNDTCLLAFLKHLSQLKDISEAQFEIEDDLLEHYISRNMNFNFFTRLNEKLVQKYHLYDKVFLQYTASSDSHVVIHYSADEDGDNFLEEDMVEVYDGIYVKTFVMFFGEMIRYYITEEKNNQVEIRESNRLTNNNVYGDSDHSRYNLINEMIISNTLADEKTLKENILEYCKYDKMTETIFKLM